jgi:hypothetical protein
VNWAIGAVKIETIKRYILVDPINNLPHIFILNYEIRCRTYPLADIVALAVLFMSCVLVKVGSNAPRNGTR